ncbi:MAG TPA: multicopper oxidase domain-containing protein [Terriglobales bacterium]|nr:multicopper oxidase domain-containing protein [Terriglobales bacterium]
MRIRIVFVFLFVLLCIQTIFAATRHYYVAAEDVVWDYAPSLMDLTMGRPIPDPWAQKIKWNKTRYIEYTDSTFSVRKPQPAWLGILGPIIRAKVGDSIVIDFLNRSSRPHSMHPHGLRYDKDNEGALYLPGGAGSAVRPGGRFTYHWLADESSGPGKADPSSLVWWYHGGTDEPVEANTGLLGPIIVTAKGKARPDGSPKDVDREFVALFMVFDQLGGKPNGLYYAINGYIFGNLPGLVMKQAERVRWYLLGMGNEIDLHTPHWHGRVVTYGNRHTDVIELMPGSMAVADMKADNPGTWLFHCHVAEHMEGGMMATYTIYQPQECSSPIQLQSADFWQTPGKFHVRVKNVGTKPISSMSVMYDHLMAPLYRRRPFDNLWNWNTPLRPGQEQTFEVPGYPHGAENIQAWILFPHLVVFADGTIWQGKEGNGCFNVFWRDKQHPDMPVLPPLFIQTGDD